MQASAEAGLAYPHHPFDTVEWVPAGESASEDAMRRDGHAARAHALQWVATGNVAHRDKAIRIVNDWTSTFKARESDKAYFARNQNNKWGECPRTWPCFPMGTDSHFLLWSRLTHGENLATTVSTAPYLPQRRRSPGEGRDA